MDLIVHLPNSRTFTAIFVVVDRFSKMAHFIPTQTQISAPELAQIFLDNVVRLHGFPRSIVSDRDPRFLSHFWRELFSLTDTTLRFLTANHPQTDGQTERTNRTLEQYLRIHARHNPASWAKYLTTAEIAYNNLTHSATGMSPFYLVYQRHANFPLDFACADLESKNAAVEALVNTRQKTLALARDNLVKARENMITHHQHKHLPTPFKLHDIVLVHKAAFRKSYTLPDLNKFDDRWYGPYAITKLINQNAYALDLPSHPSSTITSSTSPSYVCIGYRPSFLVNIRILFSYPPWGQTRLRLTRKPLKMMMKSTIMSTKQKAYWIVD